MSTDTEIFPTLDPTAAFKGYFSDPQWALKTAIGATFNALSLLLLMINGLFLPLSVLLWSVVCGYMLKVMRGKVTSPGAHLPEWTGWSDMAISGMTWFAVYCGFLLVIFALFVAFVFVGAGTGWIDFRVANFTPWAVTTFTALFVSALFISLLTTFLQVNMAQEENLPAAFAIVKVVQKFRSKGAPMFQAWLIALALNTLAVVLPLCTVVGACLLPASSFIAAAVSATLVAQAWQGE